MKKLLVVLPDRSSRAAAASTRRTRAVPRPSRSAWAHPVVPYRGHVPAGDLDSSQIGTVDGRLRSRRRRQARQQARRGRQPRAGLDQRLVQELRDRDPDRVLQPPGGRATDVREVRDLPRPTSTRTATATASAPASPAATATTTIATASTPARPRSSATARTTTATAWPTRTAQNMPNTTDTMDRDHDGQTVAAGRLRRHRPDGATRARPRSAATARTTTATASPIARSTRSGNVTACSPFDPPTRRHRARPAVVRRDRQRR